MASIESTAINFQAFEPKVQNRFIMQMSNVGIPGFMVRNVKTPSFTDQVVKLDHINTYRKIRGKREWADMTMTLYDPISPSGAAAVMDWARLSYESVTGRAGYSDFYKKDITLQMLGPIGDIVSEWVIVGAFVTSADFGQLDWAQDAVVDLGITVSMDYCVLNY